MAYKIPQPIVSYANPMAVQPSRSFVEPAEGKSFIPVELDWDGNGSTVQVNCQGVGTKPFSQIVMLDVDNTQSGADVTFYFPDSTDTLVVPAASAGLFPVFTSSLSFYAAAPNALASDVTRVRILNYRQEPVANPPPEFQNTAVVVGITATGVTNVIPITDIGTLEGYSVYLSWNSGAAGAGTIEIDLIDHASGNKIDGAIGNIVASSAFNGSLVNVSNASVRFAQGVDVKVTVTGAGFGTGSFNISTTLRYKTP